MGMMGIGSDRAVRSHEELGPYGRFASAAGTGFRTRIPMRFDNWKTGPPIPCATTLKTSCRRCSKCSESATETRAQA
jgi:hypothetical protein